MKCFIRGLDAMKCSNFDKNSNRIRAHVMDNELSKHASKVKPETADAGMKDLLYCKKP
jgi:hypothetical protein